MLASVPAPLDKVIVAVSAHLDKLIAEGLIGMAEVGRLLGTFRGGRPCHPSTPTRWCLDGVKLGDGQRLFLEYVRVSDRIMTSRAALLRFLAQQQDIPSVTSAIPPRSPAERRRANANAEAELSNFGV